MTPYFRGNSSSVPHKENGRTDSRAAALLQARGIRSSPSQEFTESAREARDSRDLRAQAKQGQPEAVKHRLNVRRQRKHPDRAGHDYSNVLAVSDTRPLIMCVASESEVAFGKDARPVQP